MGPCQMEQSFLSFASPNFVELEYVKNNISENIDPRLFIGSGLTNEKGPHKFHH